MKIFNDMICSATFFVSLAYNRDRPIMRCMRTFPERLVVFIVFMHNFAFQNTVSFNYLA